ncbi:hypothetical protein Tco_0091720 [Tanacetum coccineum]
MGLMQRKLCLQALRTQFKEFLASKGVNATDLLNQGWQQDFEYFTRCESSAYRRELLENLDTLEAVIHRVCYKYLWCIAAKAVGQSPKAELQVAVQGVITTQAVDGRYRTSKDDVPFAEVQLTAKHNILANEQHHTVQSEPIYDTHLLRETIMLAIPLLLTTTICVP